MNRGGEPAKIALGLLKLTVPPVDYGRIAYVTTDGGHTATTYHRPGSDEIIRPARVVRAQFTPENPAR